MDALKDYEAACKELKESCNRVKKHKDLFLKMAENASSWVVVWKTDISSLINIIKDLNKKVLQVIELEQNYGF